MVAMMISFPHKFNVGVKLLVRPTVAVALTVSYAMSNALASVTAASKTVETNRIIKEVHTTATALLIACFEIVL